MHAGIVVGSETATTKDLTRRRISPAVKHKTAVASRGVLGTPINWIPIQWLPLCVRLRRRKGTPSRWFITTSIRPSLKSSPNAPRAFAPEEGGNSDDGLDANGRFRLDPGLGNIHDFRQLVKQAHGLDLAVITFQNLGYSSLRDNDIVHP